MSDITFDRQSLDTHGFLGGRLQIRQPHTGYRSGSDTVLLAAAVPARPGERVLELGCGAGVASFCLASRVAGLALHGLELQPAYAALCRDNAAHLGIAMTVHEGDVARPCSELRALSFDHVFANPPYFAAEQGPALDDPGKDVAFRTETPLAVWVDCALRRLREGGTLTFILRSERLHDMLNGLAGRAGEVRLKPLAAREGREAKRLILRARKGSKIPLTLCAPLIQHEGARHEGDFPAHTAAMESICRDGAALDF